MLITSSDLQAFLQARHANPHSVLGMHSRNRGLVVRAFLRGATGCEVVEVDAKGAPAWPMKRIADEGMYELSLPRRAAPFKYQLRAAYPGGEIRQFFDPYCFLPTIGEQDLYLFNEGNEHRIYEKLGSHLRNEGGVSGVGFAVWAPSASRVSVVGNFNYWDGRYHPMRPLGNSGVWELFIPGLQNGELYKFEIRDQAGHILIKTDPYGTYFEAPPGNAAIVYDTHHFQWNDSAWLQRRKEQSGNVDRPISVYELHLGSWRRKTEDGERPLTYRELGEQLADYVCELGFTHIEIMPIAEHPFDGSWGYQVTGFFAPTHRFGTPEDFAWFVDHLHQRGIGVILDWVPAHFPRDSFALAEFDGTHLYEHADPRQGAHMDWGTLIFNYGRNEVRCFLIANALAWLDRYHLDGLRVDAVASMLYLDYSRQEGQWIPNRYGGRENLEAIDFLRRVNDLVHHYYPGVAMIAEESTSFPGVSRPTSGGGLGFDYKWNMGWMHDTLRYFSKEPFHRRFHHNDLTFGMLYQYAENFVTVFSHDEVVHGKQSLLYKMGAWPIPEKAANLRSLYAHMWAYPGKKLLFMGGEFAQSHEWKHDQSLDWHLRRYLDHEGVRVLVRDLHRLYTAEPVLSANDFNPHGFRWVAAHDTDANIIAYSRMDAMERVLFLVVGHFGGGGEAGYRIGVPRRANSGKRCLSPTASTMGTGSGTMAVARPKKCPSTVSASRSRSLCRRRRRSFLSGPRNERTAKLLALFRRRAVEPPTLHYMKFFRLALVLSAAALCALRAQDDEKQQKAPTEIPDFNNLDEYIYVPKSMLKYGFRYTTGVKAHFSGKGQVPSPEPNVDPSAPNIYRLYHDGFVAPDTRAVQTDNGNGTGSSVALNSIDGKTNNYGFDSTTQITSDGFLSYHRYSAATDDNSFDKRGKGNAGTEIFVAKDMKKLTKHWEWKIFGGVSINDIQSSSAGFVTAHITTKTDIYDTYGQTPSTSGPSTTSTVNIVDGNGNAVLDSTGTPETLSVSNTVLISNAPLASIPPASTTDALSVLNQYKLHGAYLTFRAGPQLIYNFNEHMKVELSAGPALIFAGSTYQVNEVFTPATGNTVVDTLTDTTNKLLLGYYADATFEYDITERTGFYLGAFDQSAGSYKQSANSAFGLYSTNVDFSNQEGIRTGLSFKF